MYVSEESIFPFDFFLSLHSSPLRDTHCYLSPFSLRRRTASSRLSLCSLSSLFSVTVAVNYHVPDPCLLLWQLVSTRWGIICSFSLQSHSRRPAPRVHQLVAEAGAQLEGGVDLRWSPSTAEGWVKRGCIHSPLCYVILVFKEDLWRSRQLLRPPGGRPQCYREKGAPRQGPAPPGAPGLGASVFSTRAMFPKLPSDTHKPDRGSVFRRKATLQILSVPLLFLQNHPLQSST